MVTNKKVSPKLAPLSMVDIVMRADVETIRAALDARQKIDALLAERAAAYERIATLEAQIDQVIGGPDLFVFPPPPMPVATYAMPTANGAGAPAQKSASEESAADDSADRAEADCPAQTSADEAESGHKSDRNRKGGPQN